jgi:5-enolpyruvylshikimate-3-phosphate synthase
VDEGETVIHIKAGKLQGAHLYLDTPSHTGTENLIMAASLAPGRTVIDNTAQEPEVLDVISFLTKMGARINRRDAQPPARSPPLGGQSAHGDVAARGRSIVVSFARVLRSLLYADLL